MKQTFKKLIIAILRFEARMVLQKYHPKVVAITGSIGKTTTKDSVYAVLSKFHYVRKSEKSHNSEIGLLLTVLGCPNGWNDPVVWIKNIVKGFELLWRRTRYPEFLILEVGAGKPGDIAKIAKWLRADIVILTAIGSIPAHIEFFGSLDSVLAEKASILQSLRKGGLLLVNTDNDSILKYIHRKDVKRVSFGFSVSDYQASNKAISYQDLGPDRPVVPTGVSFRVDYRGASVPVSIDGAFGVNHVCGALAGIAIAKELGLDVLAAIEALRSYEVPPGRMRILKGLKKTLIIDDTYNASPDASRAALETLAEITSAKRKIAVLGDMLELGRHTDESHRVLGAHAARSARWLVAVGPRAAHIVAGALEAGMKEAKIKHVLTAREAGALLRTKIKEGDLVLVKGSQAMRMERVVEAVMELPEYKEQVLVRQEPEWLE